MSDFVSCTGCRPIWQDFRAKADLLDLPADRRRAVIVAYMDRVHAAGHDEAAVRAQLQAEYEASEAAREEQRRAVAFWALVGGLLESAGIRVDQVGDR